MSTVAFIVVLFPLTLAGAVTAIAFAVFNRVRFSVAGAQGADAGELRSYVRTFSRTLSTLGVSRSARRRHVDELKANLAESVPADGIRAALEGLGPAGALATGYADYRPRPAWLIGLAASALTWVVVMFVDAQCGDAYGAGIMDGIGPLNDPVAGNMTSSNGWGVTFEAVLHAQHGVDVHVSSPWIWVLPVVAFFIASRSWRTLTKHRAANVES
jgi:hypothetical protein